MKRRMILNSKPALTEFLDANIMLNKATFDVPLYLLEAKWRFGGLKSRDEISAQNIAIFVVP